MNNKLLMGLVGSSLILTPLYVSINRLYQITKQPQIQEWYNTSIQTAKDTINDIEEDDTLNKYIDMDIYKSLISSWEDTKDAIYDKLEQEFDK